MNRTFRHVFQQQAGPLAILLASFLWGTTGTMAHHAEGVSPLATGAFAMGVGGLLQALLAWRVLRQDGPRLLAQRQRVLLGALGVVIYPLAFYSAMHLAGVAIGTVVSIGAAPFFTALLEWLISKKNPFTLRWLLSLGLGISGVILLIFSQASHTNMSSNLQDTIVGVLLGLIAAASYALYAWLGKLMIESGIHSKAAIGSMFLLAAVILLPSLWWTGEHLFDGMGNTSVALYMAIVPMFLGYVLFGFGLRTTPASAATILTLFEPVVAAIFAVTLVGEVLSLWGWLGMAMIGVCLLIQTWQPKAAPLEPSPPIAFKSAD